MKIEWASSFNPDGSRRKPDPSTMHGWYAKLRGTLSGNEDLRNKGMKEMRDAARFKREKARRKQEKARRLREARKAEGRSVFSFFTSWRGKKSSRTSSRSSGHRSKMRKSTGASRDVRSARPSMTPRTSHASRSSRHSSKPHHSRSHHNSKSPRSPEYSRRSSRR